MSRRQHIILKIASSLLRSGQLDFLRIMLDDLSSLSYFPRGKVRKMTKNELRERRRIQQQVYYAKNRESIIAREVDRQKKRKALTKAWKKRNPAAVRESKRGDRRKYNLVFRKSCPTWANHFFIHEAYRLARLRTKTFGFRWEVDHIVPLRSPLVCGLHTEQNLRVIPFNENLAKSNHYWTDMP